MAIGAISIATEQRNEAAALRFLGQAMSANSLPRACAIDTSGANAAGLKGVNVALREAGSRCQIRVHRSKYLANIVEQDHRGREAANTNDDGLQVFQIGKGNFGRDRHGTRDQERATGQRLPICDLCQPCGEICQRDSIVMTE